MVEIHSGEWSQEGEIVKAPRCCPLPELIVPACTVSGGSFPGEVECPVDELGGVRLACHLQQVEAAHHGSGQPGLGTATATLLLSTSFRGLLKSSNCYVAKEDALTITRAAMASAATTVAAASNSAVTTANHVHISASASTQVCNHSRQRHRQDRASNSRDFSQLLVRVYSSSSSCHRHNNRPEACFFWSRESDIFAMYLRGMASDGF